MSLRIRYVRHWLATCFTMLTFREHLGTTHLLQELPLQTMARIIPAWHPIRRMLKAHVWHSNMINHAAGGSLVQPTSIGNALFGFTPFGHVTVALALFLEYENITTEEHCAMKMEKFKEVDSENMFADEDKIM